MQNTCERVLIGVKKCGKVPTVAVGFGKVMQGCNRQRAEQLHKRGKMRQLRKDAVACESVQNSWVSERKDAKHLMKGV